MARVFNENTVSYGKREMPLPEYSWHTSERLNDFLCAKKVRMDIRSLDPGTYSFPYHFHHNAEEIFVVLTGEMTLRSLEGLTLLKQGDIAFFGAGADGAHQVHNPNGTPCRYLDIMTVASMDVCEYPDTGKILLMSTRDLFARGSDMDYFEGEENIETVWAGLKPAARETAQPFD